MQNNSANCTLIEEEYRKAYTRRHFLGNLAAGSLALAAFPLLSEPARADLFMPSIAEQIKLGKQAEQQLLKQYKEVHDSRAIRFKALGHRLLDALDAIDRKRWDYRFHVIESKEINAFAVPGGPVFLFTGLLDHIRSNSELAGVTGHEMTHVRLQHWAHAYAAQQERDLGIMGLLSIFHANNTVRSLASVGDQLYTLKFSRNDEKQADEGGLANMVAAGYNPNGMIALFHTLENATKNMSQPPAFLSDHPLTSERIKYVSKLIAQKYEKYTSRPM